MKRYHCSASWPCLACQVVFERKGFSREMFSKIYRYHAKNALPVKWCLNEKVELLCKWCFNEKVELLCKLAMPRLSSGV